MANFHDVRFPTAIALHSSGGPERKTEVVILGSGYEERNAVWANSRRRYDVGYGIRTLDDMHSVIAFFEARMGRLYSFRFRDFSDFKSCSPGATPTAQDQVIGTGDGVTQRFTLNKRYMSGGVTTSRVISKPVPGSIVVAVNGADTKANFDPATGTICLDQAPAEGDMITAGFEFDVPVRFDSDSLTINLAGFAAGDIPSIPLVEVLL